MRIAILTEIPAPFRTPLFNALAEREGVELIALFLARHDPRRPHYRVLEQEMRFRWRVLPGRELRPRGRWLVLSRGTARALLGFGPDVVVVGGWNQPAFWVALALARLGRFRIAVWVESTSRDRRPGSPLLERAKRALLGRCDGFLVPGRASLEYLVALGVAEERIAVAPNAVDLDVFRDGVAAARAAESREALRARLGLAAGRCTFLYVGRLDPEKGVGVLLAAANGLAAEIVVVGDGSEAAALHAAAPANVRFTGSLDRDALVPWYAAADAFVLPSLSEQWGMVLNEAAAASLPIVATEAAGAAWDLVEDGVSGFRVPAGDAAALAAALAALAADPALRERAGARSAALAAGHTAEAWAEAVDTAARRWCSGAAAGSSTLVA